MATTTAPTTATTLADGALLRNTRKQRSLWGNAWGQFRRHRPAMFGLVVITLFVLFCFVGIFFWDLPHNSPYVYETNVTKIGRAHV